MLRGSLFHSQTRSAIEDNPSDLESATHSSNTLSETVISSRAMRTSFLLDSFDMCGIFPVTGNRPAATEEKRGPTSTD